MLRSRQLAGYKFRRQHPIGPYIADFACVAHLLVVEADGGQDADSAADARRTDRLRAQGLLVLRFWNNEILRNTDGVLTETLRVLASRPHTRFL